jgi:PKD repeat protein
MRRSWTWPAIGYRGWLVVTLIALCTGLASPPAAIAAPPAYDDFDSAVVIGDVPFQIDLDTRDSTAAADDPECLNGGVEPTSVWLSVTPSSDTFLEAWTEGTYYFAVVSIYTGSRGSLTRAAGGCSSRQAGFFATAGTTYHFMVTPCCNSGDPSGGDLRFTLSSHENRTNDDFANATVITTLPFEDPGTMVPETFEEGEPTSCGTGVGTAWYAFTPTETTSITWFGFSYLNSSVGVYMGDSLTSLTPLACGSYPAVTFRATAGTTYFIQALRGSADIEMIFRLRLTPAPQASFSTYPSDPSTFDNTIFNNDSYDPMQAGSLTFAWQLGDGTTSTEQFPTHRYTSEGDYTVQLTATAADDRTASVSSVVRVRTHDVAITKFAVPKSAHAGQTKPITVELKNTRHPETVRIEFVKVTPSGLAESVGSVTRSVPAGPNRLASLTIDYTFTDADAALGKVTFKAYAIIEDARDAIPADNQAIAYPTKVTS